MPFFLIRFPGIPEAQANFPQKSLITKHEFFSTTDADTGRKEKRKEIKFYDQLPENHLTMTLSSRFDRYRFLILSVKNVPVECALMRFA